MIDVRTTEAITGYYVDKTGHHVDVTVPAGTIGEAGPEGRGQFANTRNVVLVWQNRDVVLPNLSPGQYAAISPNSTHAE